MGENNRDIQRLIKLKSQRPAFARMISWDMSRAADRDPGKRGRQKKKQKHIESGHLQNQVEEEDDVESGSAASSDFETANEDHVDELELSSTFCAMTTETISSLDTACIAARDSHNTDHKDSADAETDKYVADGGRQTDRRRRLSKRQKRNKRNLFKVMYIDELFNITNLFDMTTDIDDVFSETSDAVDSVEVPGRVPTLAELCLQAARCKRKRNKSGPKTNIVRPEVLPCGIKRIITDWRFNQRMLERQLSYLQNFVLSSLCVKDGVERYPPDLFYYEDSLPVRSVWCAFSKPIKDSYSLLVPPFRYPSGAATAFLYNPTMRPFPGYGANTFTGNQLYYAQTLSVSSTHCLSALATTIDIMLSNTTNARLESQKSSKDSEAIACASESMVIPVKTALSSRYPNLIDELFDRAIPYVMWARGNTGHATKMFQALIQKETLNVLKAMYLSEIAVMHTMFGDGKTAASFYKLASEMALTTECLETTINEVTEQTQVLLASIHDCGLMTEEKARAALQCWSRAVHLPSLRMATVLGAADSFLCYHLRQSTDDWWKEAESRLRTWYSSSNYIGYYVSLVLALRGKDLESTSEFREFIAHCEVTLPGEIIFPYLEKIEKRNPWNPLITIVRNQKEPVKPMKVVWRTKFRPSRLTNDRPVETDLCSCDMNLRLSESGHLTGDMQMLMPPIREITLDLQTGSIVLKNTPSFTGTWKATEMETIEGSEKVKGADFMLPTPCQIYSHEDGTSVHLMSPKLSTMWHEEYDRCCPMLLTWKGPDGRTAMINLINAVKTMQRKSLDNLLTRGSLWNKMITTEALEIVISLVEPAFNKNRSLCYTKLHEAAVNIIRTVNKDMKKQMKERQMKEKQTGGPKKQLSRDAQIKAMISKKITTLLPRFSLTLFEEPIQYGHALLIHLTCQPEKQSPSFINRRPYCHGYWLLIDTRSREAFLDYKLIDLPNDAEHPHSFVYRRQLGTNVCHDKFFMYYKTVSSNVLNDLSEARATTELSIYNDKCEMVSSLDIKDLKPYNHPNNNVNICVVGNCIFGVNRSRLSIWKDIIGSDVGARDFDLQSTRSLDPYWELDDDRKQIENVLALGTEVKGKGQFLFVHMSVGLGLMDPDTMELIPIILPQDCGLKLAEDGKVILGKFAECKLLAEKSFIEEDEALYRFIVGTENKLFLFSVSHRVGSDQLQASLLHYFFLPGIVKEACIIGKKVGLLVSLTQHGDDHECYREHIFHFRNDGLLHGLLLCLGHGPHSFCPLYIGEGEGDKGVLGWCVYMRDGHDGILCVKLFD